MTAREHASVASQILNDRIDVAKPYDAMQAYRVQLAIAHAMTAHALAATACPDAAVAIAQGAGAQLENAARDTLAEVAAAATEVLQHPSSIDPFAHPDDAPSPAESRLRAALIRADEVLGA